MPVHPFPPIEGRVSAVPLGRPHRFGLQCRLLESGRELTAYLPNPGRMWELLTDDVVFLLRPNLRPSARMPYTAVAAIRDGQTLFLDTGRTNAVARWLIENHKVPGLEDASIVRGEVRAGRSRFDFLLEQGGGEVYLEVKSCTLFAQGVAMFPDAVTERGRRHLEELGEMARTGQRGAVLFVVHSLRPQWFMPDYHTDLEFARTMLALRDRIPFAAVGVGWEEDGSLSGLTQTLSIPWDYAAQEARDAGGYFLILRLGRACKIACGALGELEFRPGHYVYAGSARRGLGARLARHKRKRKRTHWHIDALAKAASAVLPVPIRTQRPLEQELVRTLEEMAEPGPVGFGASDSPRPTHLFRFEADPLRDRRFIDALLRLRMQPPI